jgi:hypothetical protein
VGSLTLTQLVGGCELILAVAVLVAPLPSLLLGIGLWKMVTEALFMISGSLPFEWIERAGSYMVPLAMYCLVSQKRKDLNLKGFRDVEGEYCVEKGERSCVHGSGTP